MGQKPQRPDFWDALFVNWLPRTHLYAACAVAALTTILLVFAPSENVSAFKEEGALRAAPSDQPSVSAALDDALAETEKREAVVEEPVATTNQLDERVRRGDNLSTIFQRLALPQSSVYAVANADQYANELTKLQPGETISVITDQSGEIAEVIYERSALESFRFQQTEAGFAGEKLAREPDTVSAFRNVTIGHSLFLDGTRAGLSQAQIMQIANIFGWDIDFALDIQPGDTFSVLFEEQYLDGVKIGAGTILGTEFTNQGKTYKAVRYVDSKGEADYYTPDGEPMRKAFLRAPLDFTRVSSNFNPNRLHPVFKTKRPHRGVDYAAPKGTPVYAAGNGKVVKAGYSPANGNYVFIQHGGSYTTKYLHLNKRSVKAGQTVNQRQVIGTVGSTGYATGPHLHYEFLVNGTHTNPRTVALPQAEPIDKQEMARFKAQTSTLLAELSRYRATQMASISNDR